MPNVTVNGSGVIHFDGTEPNLLSALERYQLQINFHCREGYCGACRCKLLQGEVRYINEPLAFVRQGEFLPCCSIPLTDITIDIP